MKTENEESGMAGITMKHDNQSGQVLVEFAVLLPCWLLMILGVIQFSFIYTAKTVVEYASYSAARAVLVGEDPTLAAVTICSPITGTTVKDALPDPVIIPGWGALPRSEYSRLKTIVNVNSDDYLGDVSVTVQHDFELVVPVVNVFFAGMELGDTQIYEDATELYNLYGQWHIRITSDWTINRPWSQTDSPGPFPVEGTHPNPLVPP
ncbi:MAG: pilus assembly protein [Planctomycetes bacterium]|nr:pilus assembly protein [Planctomycetota bacterium]